MEICFQPNACEESWIYIFPNSVHIDLPQFLVHPPDAEKEFNFEYGTPNEDGIERLRANVQDLGLAVQILNIGLMLNFPPNERLEQIEPMLFSKMRKHSDPAKRKEKFDRNKLNDNTHASKSESNYRPK